MAYCYDAPGYIPQGQLRSEEREAGSAGGFAEGEQSPPEAVEYAEKGLPSELYVEVHGKDVALYEHEGVECCTQALVLVLDDLRDNWVRSGWVLGAAPRQEVFCTHGSLCSMFL